MLERFWSARHGGSLQLALVVDPEALFESMEESLRGLIRRHLHLVLHLREISFSEMMYTPLNSYYSYYSLNSSQSQSGVLETKPPCSSPAPSQFHQAPLEKSNRIKKKLLLEISHLPPPGLVHRAPWTRRSSSRLPPSLVAL